ncbi:MAG: hypothetical protein KN64_07110 [Sulfurovum sp. AS07-7]|nr:MAG: hypothetical protein KN64_07110 [Sulfurovum sp. AS07-7]
MKKSLLIATLSVLLSTSIYADSVVGSVNGMPIYKSEAENAVKMLTGGKQTYDNLTAEQKKGVVSIIAPSKLIAKSAKSDLSQKEQDAALSAFWMQKKASSMSVSDSEAKAVYEKLKAASKEQSKVPDFEKVKESIKMRIRQDKVIKSLMQNAKVVVN